MSVLEIQRGERGRWPKKKPEGRSQKAEGRARRVSRRSVIKKAAAVVFSMRAAGFVTWSEPKDDDDEKDA